MKMNSHSLTPETVPADSDALADIFLFLSMLMRYPETNFFDSEFLNSLESLLTSLDLRNEQQLIADWRTSTDTPLLDAQLAYTNLFINGVPHVIAPPYASVYQDGDKTYQGKTTEKTRAFYREYGFDLASESEPADHIRFELEFISCLFREEQFEAGDVFIRTFFLPWVTKFHQKILEEGGHPLYRVSLQLITFFTQEEQ